MHCQTVDCLRFTPPSKLFRYSNSPGFSNFHDLTTAETIQDNSKGGCAPPIDPLSKGFVLYAGILAFVIPSIVLAVLQAGLQKLYLFFDKASAQLLNYSIRLEAAGQQLYSKALKKIHCRRQFSTD